MGFSYITKVIVGLKTSREEHPELWPYGSEEFEESKFMRMFEGHKDEEFWLSTHGESSNESIYIGKNLVYHEPKYDGELSIDIEGELIDEYGIYWKDLISKKLQDLLGVDKIQVGVWFISGAY